MPCHAALELTWQAVEANPDSDLRTIAKRSGVKSVSRDATLERLVREGFLAARPRATLNGTIEPQALPHR
jgi:hypothetical protein